MCMAFCAYYKAFLFSTNALKDSVHLFLHYLYENTNLENGKHLKIHSRFIKPI